MSAPAPHYRKLSGRSLNWAGLGRLWIGEGYLLEVNSILILEWYRRSFLHDAMAFIVQRSKRRSAWCWVLGCVGGFGLLGGGGAGWIGYAYRKEDWHVALYVLAGIAGFVSIISLILLTINVLLGPSCRCHVLTSTGWHPLSAPTRLGPALRIQAQIAPLIEAAQNQTPAPRAGTE